MTIVYKIVPAPLWAEAMAAREWSGAPVDVADGFIHFSTADQVRETAAKHFAGQTDLLLVAVDSEALGPALRWEVSRGGALFPHLYAPFPVAMAHAVDPLPFIPGTGHDFGHLLP